MNDTTLLVAVFGGIAVATIAFAWGPSLVRDMRERRVLSEGAPAQAEILALAPTGNVFNDVQEMRIRLQVRPDSAGTAPFEAEVVRTVGVADAVRLAPGRSVAVRYSAMPPHRVAILP